MATPLAPYANARFQILPQAQTFNPLPGLRSDGTLSAGYVVDIYAKHGDRDVIEREVRGATISTIVLNGYCVRWCEVQGSMPALDDPMATAIWDTSGRFPAVLMPGSDHPGCFIDLQASSPVIAEVGMLHFVRLRNPYGHGGVGSLIADEIGDRFQLWFSRNA